MPRCMLLGSRAAVAALCVASINRWSPSETDTLNEVLR